MAALPHSFHSFRPPPHPPPACLFGHFPDRVHFLDKSKQRYRFQKKPISFGRIVRSVVGVVGVRMNMEDSRLIVRFQGLIAEMLVQKRLGHRRPELTDELYETWREVERRGLKKTPQYRDALLRADRHALWLAGLVTLAAPSGFSAETERTDTFDAPQKAA
jgi:hypothetical protein